MDQPPRPKIRRTIQDKIRSTPKKKIAAKNTMMKTIAVVTMVSLLVGQVTLETSRRTSLMNCPGFKFAMFMFVLPKGSPRRPFQFLASSSPD
jgi:Na+/glutamate symporter